MNSVNKKRKIGIIGVGHVGSHVASMLITRQLCEELVLIDKDMQVLNGQALDLADTSAYAGSRCKIIMGGYHELKDADILIISVGGKLFDENRLEELDDSMKIIDEIAPQIEKSGFHGIVISITNPCDLVAYYLNTKISATVIGSGTVLDSARFRYRISRILNLDCRSIEAWCFGEHGNSQVLVWSKVRIGGKSLDEVLMENPEWDKQFDKKRVEKSTIYAGWEIAEAKGSTEFGIGMAASELVKCILNDQHTVLPCSVLLNGEYGEEDVYVSVPCTIGANGIEKIWEIEMSKEEKSAFEQSCSLLKDYIVQKINILTEEC